MVMPDASPRSTAAVFSGQASCGRTRRRFAVGYRPRRYPARRASVHGSQRAFRRPAAASRSGGVAALFFRNSSAPICSVAEHGTAAVKIKIAVIRQIAKGYPDRRTLHTPSSARIPRTGDSSRRRTSCRDTPLPPSAARESRTPSCSISADHTYLSKPRTPPCRWFSPVVSASR